MDEAEATRQPPKTFDDLLAALDERGANDLFLSRMAKLREVTHFSFDQLIDMVVEGFCEKINELECYAPSVVTLQQAGLSDAAAQDLWERVFCLPSLYATKVEVWVSEYLAVILHPPSDQPCYPFEERRADKLFERNVQVKGKSMSLKLAWMSWDDATAATIHADEVDLIQLMQLPRSDEHVFLFHGSTETCLGDFMRRGVRLASRPNLDFNCDHGSYYVTRSQKQAWKWAWLRSANRGDSKMVIVVHRVKKDELYSLEHVRFQYSYDSEPREGRDVGCTRSYPNPSNGINNDLNTWSSLVTRCRNGDHSDGLDDVAFIEGPYLKNPEDPSNPMAVPLNTMAAGHQLCVLKRPLADMFTQNMFGIFMVI